MRRWLLAVLILLAGPATALAGSTIVGWTTASSLQINTNAQRFGMLTQCQYIEDGLTEGYDQITFRDSVSMSKLTVRQGTSTIGGDETFYVRVNGADGGSVTSTNADDNVFIVSSSNADSIIAGDLVNFRKSTRTAGGSGGYYSMTAQLTTAGTPTVYLLGASTSVTVPDDTSSYTPIVGAAANNFIATPDTVEHKIEAAGSAHGFQFGLDRTTSAFDITGYLSINGVDSALTCTISAGASECVDTTNSARVEEGDLVSVRLASTFGAGTPDLLKTAVFVTSDTAMADIASSGFESFGVGPFTRYVQVIGTLSSPSTNTDIHRIRMPFATTAGALRVYGLASGAGDSTVTLRVNGVATSANVTLPANVAIAWNEDDCNDSVAIAEGDTIDYEVVSPAGSTGTQVRNIGLTLNYDTGVGCGVTTTTTTTTTTLPDSSAYVVTFVGS